MSTSVFVIDDDPDFLEVAGTILRRCVPDLTVYTASSGGAALALFRQVGTFLRRPAFVVLDYHLGDRTAPTLLNEIRLFAELRDVPVLVLSQFIWQRDALAAMSAGAVQCSPKPSRVGELGELLLRFWGEHEHGKHSPGRG